MYLYLGLDISRNVPLPLGNQLHNHVFVCSSLRKAHVWWCDGDRLCWCWLSEKSQEAAVTSKLEGFTALTGSCGSQLLHRSGSWRAGQVIQVFYLKTDHCNYADWIWHFRTCKTQSATVVWSISVQQFGDCETPVPSGGPPVEMLCKDARLALLVTYITTVSSTVKSSIIL